MMTTTYERYTLPEVARMLGVRLHQAEYAVRSYGIDPVARIGNARVYDTAAIERIRSALDRIADRRHR